MVMIKTGAFGMTDKTIEIRLSKKEKVEFEQNAKNIGLTAAAAIKVFITKFNYDQGFGYPVITKKVSKGVSHLPIEVEKALLIARAEELGLLEDNSEMVDDIQGLRLRWLH